MVLTESNDYTTITLENVRIPRPDAFLPTEHGNFRIRSFPELSSEDHCAIYSGQPWDEDAPLVRIHSECLTGDALGSLKCDCGPQLKRALNEIQHEGVYVLTCFILNVQFVHDTLDARSVAILGQVGTDWSAVANTGLGLTSLTKSSGHDEVPSNERLSICLDGGVVRDLYSHYVIRTVSKSAFRHHT